jgi:hypothetical protein
LLRQLARTAADSRVRAAEVRLCAAVALLIALAVLASTVIQAPPWLQSLALFGHLAFLTIGFGSVIGIDYYGLLWLTRRITLTTMLRHTHRMSLPIWVGVAGLVATGALLHPQLGSGLTLLKMGAVLLVAVGGVLALSTKRAMVRQLPTVSRALLIRGLVLASASRALWWTAVLVGFVNRP